MRLAAAILHVFTGRAGFLRRAGNPGDYSPCPRRLQTNKREIEMKLSIKQVASALLLGAMTTSAFAGLHSSQGVTIQPSGIKPYATGDIGFVYNSWFSNDYIGCEANAASGDCYATDVSGQYKTCTTTDPAMLTVIRSIKGDSNVFFSWNPDGTCRDIRVQTDSLRAPK
jgi:hypothetical protein